ncbi:uncharacterized protein V1518DRAFT_420633 [Limtongia smithiae]|uniref:uncharacterized protein n=1 Tax=Limtongia smithiae TaxID=1125753 RepID=UPI0034CDF2C5
MQLSVAPARAVKALVLAVSALFDILLATLALHVLMLLCAVLRFIPAPSSVLSMADQLAVLVNACTWGYLLFLIQSIKRTHISFSGDLLDPSASAVLLCNKRCAADYILLAGLADIYCVRGRMRFLAWRSLFAVPCAMWAALSLWVAQDWGFKSDEQLAKVLAPVSGWEGVNWVVTFPETLSFTREIAEEHSRYCRANGLPVLTHCLYPRFEAVVPTLKYLLAHSAIDYVYDVTFIYKRNDQAPHAPLPVATGILTPSARSPGSTPPPTLPVPATRSLVSTPSLVTLLLDPADTWELHVHVSRVTAAEVPVSRRGLERFVERMFVGKERLLSGVETHGMAYKGLGYVYYTADEVLEEGLEGEEDGEVFAEDGSTYRW